MHLKPPFYPEPDLNLHIPEDAQVMQDPAKLTIGICHRCSRRGLLRKDTRNCTGYMPMRLAGGTVYEPIARAGRCYRTAMHNFHRNHRGIA